MKNKYWRVYAPEGDEGSGGGAGESGVASGGDSGSSATGGTGTPGATTQSAGTTTTQTAAGTTGQSSTPGESGYWPSDWRERASKGDEKLAARFGRYQSPDAALTALIAAQNRVAAGELKPVLGKNPTVEEVKSYREALGIPEAHDKYQLDLGKEFKVADEDKSLIDIFLKAAHETYQTPAQVNAAVKAYYAANEQINEARAAKDIEFQQSSEDTLRAEWGEDFRKNINVIKGLLDRTAGEDLKNNFLGGRLADGTAIGSSPEALKFLMGLALIDNPAGTVVPNNGGNMQEGLAVEIEKIEKVMKENRKTYDKDEKMQERLRELYGAREKLKSRAA